MGNILEIKNLHASIEGGREILKGINLCIGSDEVHALMGPNGAGKSTLSAVLTGRPGYEITSGEVSFLGQDLLSMKPEERAWAGLFLSFQYPVEIPGVSVTGFIKAALAAKRKAEGLPELSAGELLKLMNEKCEMVGMKREFIKRDVNAGFSGGEKKRNEIFQMALLEPKFAILDETDSGLDVDALKIVAQGVNSMKSAERSFLLITHYHRLLELIVPDKVHILKDGVIVADGGKELADEVDKKGFDLF